MAQITAPTATTVREWASRKGIEVAAHGRLSAEVIEAFNKGRKNTYAPTMVQADVSRVIEVPGFRIGKNGRKVRVTEKVTNAEVRTWAIAAGLVNEGSRGRLSAEVLAAFGSRDLPTGVSLVKTGK